MEKDQYMTLKYINYNKIYIICNKIALFSSPFNKVIWRNKKAKKLPLLNIQKWPLGLCRVNSYKRNNIVFVSRIYSLINQIMND